MQEGLTESDAVKYLNDINYKACVGEVSDFIKGLLLLGLAVILFLLADYLQVDNFKELFWWTAS